MSEIKESCWDHVSGEDFVTYSSSEKKWLNRFLRDAETYPGEVIVKHVNEDGSMVVQYPYSWCRMPRPPRKVNMTDERKAELSERLATARASRKHTDEA